MILIGINGNAYVALYKNIAADLSLKFKDTAHTKINHLTTLHLFQGVGVSFFCLLITKMTMH